MGIPELNSQQALELLGITEQDATRAEPITLAEASRLSLMRMASRGAQDASSGSLRLHGEGVHGHSADLEKVGGVMVQWQRLVTSIGAAMDGVASLRGRLPAPTVSQTQLKATSGLAPGSLVINVEPSADYDDQQDSLFEVEAPAKADAASQEAIALLEESASDDLDDLLTHLRNRGPRVASALRHFLRTIADAKFDTDAMWTVRGERTRTSVSAVRAGIASEAIKSRDLDDDEITLRGVLITSSVERKLDLDVGGEDGLVQIDRGDIPRAALGTLPPMTLVDVECRVTSEQGPGGDVVPRYKGLSIRRVDDGSPTN